MVEISIIILAVVAYLAMGVFVGARIIVIGEDASTAFWGALGWPLVLIVGSFIELIKIVAARMERSQ